MSGRESTVSTYLNVVENFNLSQQRAEQELQRLIQFEAEKLAVIALTRHIISSGESGQGH